MKLTKERSRLSTRKFFFDGWNCIPVAVVNTESANAFKNAYGRNYESDMDARSR